MRLLRGEMAPPLGRPAELDAARRISVTLGARHVETAQAIGNGNVSAGLRRALDALAG